MLISRLDLFSPSFHALPVILFLFFILLLSVALSPPCTTPPLSSAVPSIPTGKQSDGRQNFKYDRELLLRFSQHAQAPPGLDLTECYRHKDGNSSLYVTQEGIHACTLHVHVPVCVYTCTVRKNYFSMPSQWYMSIKCPVPNLMDVEFFWHVKKLQYSLLRLHQVTCTRDYTHACTLTSLMNERPYM